MLDGEEEWRDKLQVQPSNIQHLALHSDVWCFFCPVNVGQATFEALAQIVRRVHGLLEDKNDHNGRNSVLASYIQYCCTMPHQGLVHQGWLVFFISHNLHKFYVLHKWKIIR